MITVTFNNIAHNCAVAYKGADYIHLVDSDGNMVASFDGVTDFSAFLISGGSFTTPASDDNCYIAVVREDGTIGKGGHKCSDIGNIGDDPRFNTVTANKVYGAVYM